MGAGASSGHGNAVSPTLVTSGVSAMSNLGPAGVVSQLKPSVPGTVSPEPGPSGGQTPKHSRVTPQSNSLNVGPSPARSTSPAPPGGRSPGSGASKRLNDEGGYQSPNRIQRRLQQERNMPQASNQKHKKVVCTLVVGPRSSGKTTLIKQARICCGYRFSQEELQTARSLMRLCVFDSVKCLWREIHRLNYRIQNTEMMELLQRALSACSMLNGTIVPNDELIGAIGNFVYDYEVQNFIETNNLQRKIYSSTFDYAISHIKRILADDYIPSLTDLMHIDYMGGTDSKRSLGSLAQKQLLAMANGAQGHEKSLQAVEIGLPSKHSIVMMEISGELTGKRYLLNQPEAFDCILYVYDVSQHGAMNTRDGITKSVLMRNIDNMQNSVGRLRQFASKPLLVVVNKFDVLLKKLIGIPLERSFPDHEGGLDPSAIKDTIVRHIRSAFEGRTGVVHIFFANALDSLDVLQPVIDLMLIGRWISLIDRVRRTAQSSQKTTSNKLQMKAGPNAAVNAIKLDERVYSEVAAQDLDEMS